MRRQPRLYAWMKSQTKGGLIPEHLDQMRVHYGDRVQRYTKDGTAPECTAEAIEMFQRLRHETLTAERLAVIRLRNDGVISDDVLHRLRARIGCGGPSTRNRRAAGLIRREQFQVGNWAESSYGTSPRSR